MNPTNHPFPDHSVLGVCIKLAHATFFDALPANVELKAPKAPETLGSRKLTPDIGLLHRWMNGIDHWFYRQQMKQREAYLAESQDIFDLESRIRHLERRPYY